MHHRFGSIVTTAPKEVLAEDVDEPTEIVLGIVSRDVSNFDFITTGAVTVRQWGSEWLQVLDHRHPALRPSVPELGW